jgi:hypothetical protein
MIVQAILEHLISWRRAGGGNSNVTEQIPFSMQFDPLSQAIEHFRSGRLDEAEETAYRIASL